MPEAVDEDQIHISYCKSQYSVFFPLNVVQRSAVTGTSVNVYIVNINVFSPAFFSKSGR